MRTPPSPDQIAFFFESARRGHLPPLQTRLAMDAGWARVRHEKRTALIAAAAHGQFHAFPVLLPYSDCTATDNERMNVLMHVARWGRLDVLQAIVNATPDTTLLFSQQSTGGLTALMMAVEHGHLDCVRYLAAHTPMELREFDHEARNALGLAIHHEHPECLRALLPHCPPDLFAQLDQHGRGDTLLTQAAQRPSRSTSVECLHLLLPHCDPMAGDAMKQTPLQAAATHGNLPFLQVLIDIQAFSATSLLNAFGRAVTREENDCAVALWGVCAPLLRPTPERAAYPMPRNADGGTPRLLAAYHGSLDLFPGLLELSDASERDHDGDGALHVAVTGFIERFEFDDSVFSTPSAEHTTHAKARLSQLSTLLAIEAEHAPNHKGDTPLLLALNKEREYDSLGSTLLEWIESADPHLREKTYDGSALISALLSERTSLIERLLPHATQRLTPQGRTALMLAVETKNPDIVRAVLPYCDAQAQDNHGMNALMLAASCGAVGVLDLLLPHSDPQAVSIDGHTALFVALLRGSPDCALRLLDPRFFHPRPQGQTALMFALQYARGCLAQFPLGEARLVDDCGRTALMLAAGRGDVQAVLQLLPVSDPLACDHEGLLAIDHAVHKEAPANQGLLCADALAGVSPIEKVRKIWQYRQDFVALSIQMDEPIDLPELPQTFARIEQMALADVICSTPTSEAGPSPAAPPKRSARL